jgi:putative transposase
MKRSQKIRIYPNNKQETFLKQSCGCARLTYNYCLAKWQEDYKNGIKHNYFTIKKHFNSIKREKFPFVYDVSKWCLEAAIQDLGAAFKNFYQKRAKYPKFHKKGIKDSFRIDGSVIKIQDGFLLLPKGVKLKMSEKLRWSPLKIYNVTISCTAGMWFVSINMEIPDKTGENQTGLIGIDVGIKEAAVLSDGQVFPNPRLQQKHYKRLRQLSKSVSRKKKGGRNWLKAVKKLSKFHYRMACCRNDWIHKFTTSVTNRYAVICLEDLNVSGMVRNHKLAKAILDVSFFDIRHQFEYKAKEVRFVNRFAPTSKTCHCCDWVNENLTLSDRTFVCQQCGITVDRDLNAAKNIVRWATPEKPVVKNALAKPSGLVKRSRGQEINTKPCK